MDRVIAFLLAAAAALPRSASAEPLEAAALEVPLLEQSAELVRCLVFVPLAGPLRSAPELSESVAAVAAPDPIFDWVSPVFVWVEPGYAYAETSVSFE